MTTPDAARWAEMKAVFAATVELPPGARQALIVAAQLPPDLLAELHSLLAHHDDATGGAGFMAQPAGVALDESAARIGQRLGDWEIVRAIGAGGMGEVFEVRRADGQYDGRAAVKLLKRGMDSAAVLARFAQERQALARLSHPHIARLLDAGASDDGLPYFVLEFVDGQPIDEAVRGLNLEQRLALFLQLADAVVYAHRNLLVHRDLKPGNVLVDSASQVKLLDFGIAKALDPLEHAQGDTTVGGVRPYTPNYASPEQMRGEPVGTATDIYSLGVLLYQMLTGTRPTGRHATTPQEAARSLLEDAPTRPSSLGSDQVPDPHWLSNRKRLAGDLDNILLKALEKPAERRYASVDALAADVRAHLAGRPVSARPASWGYVASRFVQRNRWAVAGATLAVASLAVGLGVALVQAERAARANRAADAQLANVKELLRSLVVRYSYGVWLTPKGSTLMQSFVQDSLPRLDLALAAAPQDMELKAIGADIYGRLAEMMGPNSVVLAQGELTAQVAGDKALQLGLQALPTRMADGGFVSRVAIGRVTLASVAQASGKPAEGEVQLRAALRDVDASLLLDKTPAGRAFLRGARGSIFLVWGKLYDHGGDASLGNPEKALELLASATQEFDAFVADRAGIDAINAASPVDDIDTEASVLQALGGARLAMAMVQVKQGRIDAAQVEATRSSDVYERIVRDFRANVMFDDGLVSANNMQAQLAVRTDRAEAALRASTSAWLTNNKLIGSEGVKSRWAGLRPWVAVWHGAALQMAARPAEAKAVLAQALPQWQGKAEAEAKIGKLQRAAHRLGVTGLYLARAERDLGQRAQALATTEATLAGLAPALAAPQRVAETLSTTAELLLLQASLKPATAHANRSRAHELAQEALGLALLPQDIKARAEQLLSAR